MTISELLSNPATWIILAAVSEVIALSPLRSNSIIQLLLQAAFSLKPKKTRNEHSARRPMAFPLQFTEPYGNAAARSGGKKIPRNAGGETRC